MLMLFDPIGLALCCRVLLCLVSFDLSCHVLSSCVSSRFDLSRRVLSCLVLCELLGRTFVGMALVGHPAGNAPQNILCPIICGYRTTADNDTRRPRTTPEHIRGHERT